MDEERVFKALEKQTKPVLLELLRSAYSELSTTQRRWIFGEFAEQRPSRVDGKKLLCEVKAYEK